VAVQNTFPNLNVYFTHSIQFFEDLQLELRGLLMPMVRVLMESRQFKLSKKYCGHQVLLKSIVVDLDNTKLL
jgi:hypothetical protein